jgi:hypothetical protein
VVVELVNADGDRVGGGWGHAPTLTNVFACMQ